MQQYDNARKELCWEITLPRVLLLIMGHATRTLCTATTGGKEMYTFVNN